MDKNIFPEISKIIERESKSTTNRDDTEPETPQQAIDTNISPDIVLSETFIDYDNEEIKDITSIRIREYNTTH